MDFSQLNPVCTRTSYFLDIDCLPAFPTNSMEQSLTKSLVSRLVSKSHTFSSKRVYQMPLTVPILSHINSVHAPPNDFFQIHFHIIFPSMNKLQSGFFPSKCVAQPKFSI